MESAENREQSPKANQPKESQDSESLSKIETIKLLNDSIDQLESTIKNISKDSAKNLPSSDSINTLLNTTQKLADSVTSPSLSPEAVVEKPIAEKAQAVTTIEATPIENNPIPPAEIKSKPAVNSLPPKRSAKSAKKIEVKRKKSNKGLISLGIIATAIALVGLIWFRLPQIKAAISSAPETREIASKIEEKAIDQEILSTPEVTDIPVVNPDVAIDFPSEENIDSNTPTTETEPEIAAPLVIPQDLTSPGRSKNLKIETVEPELTFTPEQTLIAALQGKLAEVTQNYDSDLFNNIRVSLPEDSLLIEVTEKWYELNESRQAKLANDILKRTRQLNFSKLELQDPAGTLIARNPVVGDRAIILQSEKDN